MMCIPLNHGKVALVDDEDYDRVSTKKWRLSQLDNRCYAEATPKIKMHRFILNAPKNMQVDHKNHDTLDNRKQNIRICTSTQNQGNKIKPAFKGATSKYKGVGLDRVYNTWRARISKNGKMHYLGRFGTEAEAAMAYDIKAIELYGDFAYLNFPKKDALSQEVV